MTPNKKESLDEPEKSTEDYDDFSDNEAEDAAQGYKVEISIECNQIIQTSPDKVYNQLKERLRIHGHQKWQPDQKETECLIDPNNPQSRKREENDNKITKPANRPPEPQGLEQEFRGGLRKFGPHSKKDRCSVASKKSSTKESLIPPLRLAAMT